MPGPGDHPAPRSGSRGTPRDPELPLPAPPVHAPVHDAAHGPGLAAAAAPRRIRAPVEYGPPVDLFTPRVPVAATLPPVPPPAPQTAPASPPQVVPTTETMSPIPVQRVSPDSLIGAASRPDPYLYLIAERADAERLLRGGLFPDAADPPVLLERRGVPAALAVLEEDGTGTGGLALLRVRRLAVAELIEDDPDRGGGGRFLLSGRGGS